MGVNTVNTFKNLMIYINLTLESFADHDNLTPIVIYFNKEKYNSFVYLYVPDFNQICLQNLLWYW